MKYCNGGHEQESKTRTKPALHFSLRSATRKVRGYCILERIASSKAYLQAESNTEWGRSSYLQNEHKRVFIILWPSASHGEILFTGFSFPFGVAFIYMQFLMNARNSFRFSSSSVSKVIWWNKRECVTVVETQDIIVSKRFIYSLSLKFRERISSGKF